MLEKLRQDRVIFTGILKDAVNETDLLKAKHVTKATKYCWKERAGRTDEDGVHCARSTICQSQNMWLEFWQGY